MTAVYLKELCQPGQTVNPLFNHLGIALLKLDDSGALLACTATAELMQGAGVLAGGILATLADEAMAHAVLHRLGPEQRTATVECSIRFLRPVHQGETVKALAWILKQGRSIISAEAEIRDSSDRLAAKSAASFMILG